jgi:uncharacterized membrane protein
MSKIAYGITLGGILGVLDGLTAWFTPEVRPMLLQIVIGSTIKGIIAGAIIGIFAEKVQSMVRVTLFGLGVGFFFAFIIAYLQHGHYFAILVPGSLAGLIVGYATQRHGSEGSRTA